MLERRDFFVLVFVWIYVYFVFFVIFVVFLWRVFSCLYREFFWKVIYVIGILIGNKDCKIYDDDVIDVGENVILEYNFVIL